MKLKLEILLMISQYVGQLYPWQIDTLATSQSPLTLNARLRYMQRKGLLPAPA